MQILDHPTQLCMLVTAQWGPVRMESILLSACWAMHPQESLDFHRWHGCPLNRRCIHLRAGHLFLNMQQESHHAALIHLLSPNSLLSISHSRLLHGCHPRQKAGRQGCSLPLACYILSDRVQPPPLSAHCHRLY